MKIARLIWLSLQEEQVFVGLCRAMQISAGKRSRMANERRPRYKKARGGIVRSPFAIRASIIGLAWLDKFKLEARGYTHTTREFHLILQEHNARAEKTFEPTAELGALERY